MFMVTIPTGRDDETPLRDVLPVAEYAALARQGYMPVPSAIRAGRMFYASRGGEIIWVYDGGEPTSWLCVGPTGGQPSSNVVITHKLWLEAAEDEYLQVATHYTIWSRADPLVRVLARLFPFPA